MINYDLLSFAIEREEWSSSLISAGGIMCGGTESDSREDGPASYVILCVWNDGSAASTHNQHFVAVKKKAKTIESINVLLSMR